MKKLVVILSIIIVIMGMSMVVMSGCLGGTTVSFRTDEDHEYTETEYAIIDHELVEVSSHTYRK